MKINFSAINTYQDNNIPELVERSISGKEYVTYGEDNHFPEYLWNGYLNTATLQAIINTLTDYISGNKITTDTLRFTTRVNKTGEDIESLFRKVVLDYLIYGGFAIQVIRGMSGEINELYHLDFKNIRSNESNTLFYYSKDWTKYRTRVIKYPVYDNDSPTSILYFKGNITRSVYPIPVYNAALIACELERDINAYHINSINNNFSSSAIINFNNGQPNDEQKSEIEDAINEKFSGYQNASRILISYNDSSDNATTIDQVSADSFDEKYQALSDRTQQQLFTAFRCSPMLLGIDQSGNFNENEYNSAYKLFNRTVVMPIQKMIIKALSPVVSVKIIPFEIDLLDDEKDIIDNKSVIS